MSERSVNSMSAAWCAARVADARAWRDANTQQTPGWQHVHELLSQLDAPPAATQATALAVAEAEVARLRDKLEQGWNLLHYGVAALMADDADGVVKCWEEGAKVLYLPEHRDIRPDFAPPLEVQEGGQDA